jgi:O-methyltransferase
LRVKRLIASIPVLGPLARRLFRLLYYRLPTRYPGSPLARADVRRTLALAVEYAYCGEVQGDLAEFGTMSGETAATLARAMTDVEALYRWPARRLRLFDSFQGLPEPSSAVDKGCVHVRSGTWAAGACMVLTKERLEFKIGRTLAKDRFEVHDGWFKDTVKELASSQRFALLHLDCDLYESTLDALEPLFARGQVSTGAVLLFDDWNTNRASPRFGQRRAWAELTTRHGIVFGDEGAYGVFGRKLIVLDYQRADK